MTIFTLTSYIDYSGHKPSKRYNQEPTPLPLLTIFTTFKEDTNNETNVTHHEFAHRLAIKNWASFSPYVRPVVFSNTTDGELIALAKEYKWDILPMTRVNSYGTPFLKEMYQEVFKNYNSTFYGYANGDLLFDASLIETLLEI